MACAPGVAGIVFTNNDDAYQTALGAARLRASACGLSIRAAAPRAPCRARRAQPASMSPQVPSSPPLQRALADRALPASRLPPIARARAASSPRRKSPAISSPCRAAGIRHCISGATMAARSSSTMAAELPAGPPCRSDQRGGCRQRHLCSRRYHCARPRRRARRQRKRHDPRRNPPSSRLPKAEQESQKPLEPIWFAPATGKYNEGNKHFIDFQNDVTVADLELAQREGYESVEHHQALHHLRHGDRPGQDLQPQRPRRSLGGHRQEPFRKSASPPSGRPIRRSPSARLPARCTKNLFLPVRRTPIYPLARGEGRDLRAGRPVAPRLYLSARRRGQACGDQPRNPQCAEQGGPARRLDARQDRDQGPGCGGIPRPRLYQHVLDLEGRPLPLRPDDERAGLPHRRRRDRASGATIIS